MPAKKPAARSATAPALITPAARESGLLRFFPFQDESLVNSPRLSVDEWARQTGKTFKGSAEGLLVCSTIRRAMAVTLSASIRQGELVLRKDAEVWRSVVDAMRRRCGQDSALAQKDQLLFTSSADTDSGGLLDVDAIAEQMDAGRLEVKIRWGRAADDYSVHKLFAANPDTARGATADYIFWDEAFLTPEFREVLRAIRSMMARKQRARLKIASSPPIRSSHESWQITYHEDIFPVNPRGNWRRGKAPANRTGMAIHRVDAYDAEAGGVNTYDEDTGRVITIAEAREKSDDPDGFDREALLIYRSSGGSAIPYSALTRAQAEGRGQGEALDLSTITELNGMTDEGLRTALEKLIPEKWAVLSRGDGQLAFGHDQSTSDKEGQSNPSALVAIQAAGMKRIMRLCVRWLSRFPRVNDFLLEHVITQAMRHGLNLKGMGIDASNEVFNALRLQARLRSRLTVRLYKNGEKHPAKPMNWKEHLANQYAQLFTDGIIAVPADGNGRNGDWLLADHSLAEKGPSGIEWKTSRGNHADTFAAAMLAEEILTGGTARLKVETCNAGTMQQAAEELAGEEGFLIGDNAPRGSLLI